MPQRTSTVILTSYMILRGVLQKGMSFYGPFVTEEEAIEYGGKNFPDDTAYVIPLYKETHTHGEDT